MSKLLNKWFGSGKKKYVCKEPCCVAKRENKLGNTSSSHLESECGEGGRKKSVQNETDGKKFSKALTSCRRDNEDDSLTDRNSIEGMGCYGPQTQSELEYMPVSKNDAFYNMNHPSRGKALIFNFDTWDNTSIGALELKPRLGSKKDKEDLTACLKDLDFEVVCYDNLTNKEFWKVIKEVRREDHRLNDCIIIAILTHGEKNHIYMKCGTLQPVNLVWEEFEAHRAPTLAAKPKIFFVQACRGTNYDHGTKLNGSQETVVIPTNDTTDSATFSYTIPNSADIIVAFSCPLGHYSWRHPQQGSWFIQSICKVFTQYGYEKDLNEMLTIVAREVALNNESNHSDPAQDKKKQVTSTSSTLIRIVKFHPKIKAPPLAGEANGQLVGHVNNGSSFQDIYPRQEPTLTEIEGAVVPVDIHNHNNINNGSGDNSFVGTLL